MLGLSLTTENEESSNLTICDLQKAQVCLIFGSIITTEFGWMSGGTEKVTSSPGRMVVVRGTLTNLWLDLDGEDLDIESNARRDGGEDWTTQ